jgi:steroid 5-alpha reductase family enzyme
MLATAIPMVLIGAGLVILMMFVLWLIHLRLGNASIVDPGWSYGLAVVAVAYAVLGPGYAARRWLAAGMAVIWGLRLGTYLLLRIIGKPEEGRYQQLRRDWGNHIALRFLAFFEFQAILDVLLSVPFLVASLNSDPAIHSIEYAGAALWLIALLGETAADAQLAAFKKSVHAPGEVCQLGLWNYSRHPNYFFEWLIWVAWAVFALASPYGWLALIGPVLMLYFLFRLTGIPATEAQALRSKGDAYRRYQQTTSAFVPWFKSALKSSPSPSGSAR